MLLMTLNGLQILFHCFTYLYKKLIKGDIANVIFLHDDMVHLLKYNIIAHKFRYRSALFIARHRPRTVFTVEKIQ